MYPKNTISKSNVSLKELYSIFQIPLPNDGKLSMANLYDELEWNLVDLPIRGSILPMSFFRGKTIVTVWHNHMRVFPPVGMKQRKETIESIEYDVIWSSYENYYLYPSYNVFDRNQSTFCISKENVYDFTGKYVGNAVSRYFDSNENEIIVYGEWIQLKVDTFTIITKFSIEPCKTKEGNAPSEMYIIGYSKEKKWRLLNHIVFTLPYTNNSDYSFYLNNIIPCSAFRLICTRTSPNSSNNTSSFCISDLKLYGITDNDKVPSVKVTFENGVVCIINDNYSDLDEVKDGLTLLRIKDVECGSNTKCILYKGNDYHGSYIEIDSFIEINDYYSSIRVSELVTSDIIVPFTFDGLEFSLMFGNSDIRYFDDFSSKYSIISNATFVNDSVRGTVCKFRFSPQNIWVPDLFPSEPFTFMFWIKVEDTTNDLSSSLFESSNMKIVIQGKLISFTMLNCDKTFSDEMENTWIHYCVQIESSSTRLYRNGVLHRFDDAITIKNKPNGNKGCSFGKDWKTYNNIFIDNIRYYNIIVDPKTLKHLFDFEYFNPNY